MSQKNQRRTASKVKTSSIAIGNRFMALLQAGTEALLRGRIEDAIRRLDLAHQLQPDNPDAAHNLSSAYILRGRFSKALPLLQKLVANHPDNANFWLNLVGGGAYDKAQTVRNMADVIPPNAEWVQTAAIGFEPDNNLVNLADGRSIGYRQLIVCPGIRLAWEKIDGLQETLGKNGVTSNYHFDLAPYTWSLTKNLKSGKALFTQPSMPIKCAGAPQKAMYLSSDYWLRHHLLDNIEVEFNTAGAVLFGVADFVPPLMEYVKRYHAKLAFNSNLVKVDGTNKIAVFDIKDSEGNVTRMEKPFDMLHVVPPQVAPPTR